MEPLPLRLGDPKAFAHVEHALRSTGFDEATICQALGIASMADLGTVRREELDFKAMPSRTLALLIRLFLLLEPVSREAVTPTIDRATLDALLALDLLRLGPGPSGSEAFFSSVLLYPVAGLLIASDRHENPDGSPFVPPPDVVFPAIFAGTLRFLRILPQSAADDVLDLCAGTGIGALVLSRHAQHTVAADITPRAVHFARFNCLLNRCHNVELAQGDLYQPAEGRTFDRIVAHPPYVPAVADTQIFRDAGETGEAILRRIIEGLPQYLREGGAFYTVTAGWDAKDGPFEERVRRWLGAAHEEFDVLFAVHEERSAADVADWLAKRSTSGDPSQLTRWDRLFAEAGVERNVYGALVLERSTAGRAVAQRRAITRRLRLSPLSDGSSFEWLLRWLRWRERKEGQGELAAALLGLGPRLGPRLRVNVAYAPQPDGLAIADLVLETDRPFAAATRIDPWMFPLVARFNGERSAEAVYQSAREAAELPEGFGPEDLTTLLAMMIERGYVEVDEPAVDG